MTIKVGINGFGRIGRCTLAHIAASGRDDIEVIKVNATGPLETAAHLIKYDSVHGRFPGTVTIGDGTLDLGRGPMQMFSTYDMAELDWDGCDVVLECTGKFNDGEKAKAHLERGAKKVLLSAPGKNVDKTVVSRMLAVVDEIAPELVTMENVPELADRGRSVLDRFIDVLKRRGYWVAQSVVRCEEYRIPQIRRRFVLLASRLGPIEIPRGTAIRRSQWRTVEQTIGHLPEVASGAACPTDRLHTAARLSELNMRRIRATPRDGGTQRDWPPELLLNCHSKQSGRSFYQIYGRMWWKRPAPTMTTLCTGLGNGRFGHPHQDRAITLREAALLQTFPEHYDFWPDEMKLNKTAVSRLIGNSVPPKLAKVLGGALLEHVQLYQELQDQAQDAHAESQEAKRASSAA